MKIKEFQDLMRELYYHQDSKRGLNKTFYWLIEEVGELSSALKAKDLDKKNIGEEIADIVAWICSLANLLDVDIQSAILQKYPKKCPKCMKNPCECGTE
ncbi:MAG: hypothetical protein BAJALOKI3v1_60037 [Promethearchaeota archaeon]|nr:MAG: hypothetical protein BAJALOKI3v1_60037 [Candidatus Lokiarchaeota archaeon]